MGMELKEGYRSPNQKAEGVHWRVEESPLFWEKGGQGSGREQRTECSPLEPGRSLRVNKKKKKMLAK